MTALPLGQLAADLATRARADGHRVLSVAPGRWNDPDTFPRWCPLTPDGKASPNDLLDRARDAARDRVPWVHAVLDTYADAMALACAVRPVPAVPRQRTRRGSSWRDLLRRPAQVAGGDPRRACHARLVEQMPLSVVTHVWRHQGRTLHVVEIPAPWLTGSLTAVTR
jgi:hypothetical protein